MPTEDEDTLQVATVIESCGASGAVLRTFPAAGPGEDDVDWLNDRWLVLVSEDRLVLYDAVADVVVAPDLPLSSIGALAWQPTV